MRPSTWLAQWLALLQQRLRAGPDIIVIIIEIRNLALQYPAPSERKRRFLHNNHKPIQRITTQSRKSERLEFLLQARDDAQSQRSPLIGPDDVQMHIHPSSVVRAKPANGLGMI